MKSIIFLFFILFATDSFSQTSDEVKLVNAVKDFHLALVRKNTISINQQTDKALTYGHSNGWVETKIELMNHLETGKMVYKTFTEDSLQVQMNGNMANVRFNAIINGELNGIPGTYNLKVLEVWVKKGNRWLLFARQGIKKQ